MFTENPDFTLCSFVFLQILTYFEVLLGWGGYPQRCQCHPVLPVVVFRCIWGGIWEALGRIRTPRGPHSRHFLATMGPKVPPVERKSGGARPICIFGGSGEGKVRIFRTVNVDNIL